MTRGATRIEGVRLSSPDKVLYREQGITKRALADYYMAVSDAMLAHLAHRPITLLRCPAGIRGKCFYQRHAGSGVPEQLGQAMVAGMEKSGKFLFVKDRKGLVALAQMGVLEIHPWNARIDRPDRPDRIVFDLDPGEGVQLSDVVVAAHDLRTRLSGLGLHAFVKTTGGKGLHVVVPIGRRYRWERVKSFARTLAESMAHAQPDRYLTRMPIAERAGRIFIDYLRNDASASAVAPYSARSRPGAPVATPLHWDELNADLDAGSLTIDTVPGRLDTPGTEPWSGMAAMQQVLPRLTGRGQT